MNLNSSQIIITGASSGIGKASALLLAKKGAQLILLARNSEKLKEVQLAIEKNGAQATFYSIDLSDEKRTSDLAGLIIKKHGIPDCIINCAGSGRWLSLSETPMGEFDQMIASPLNVTVNTCKAFLPFMKEKNKGHIITINSVASFFSFPGATGYITARWALRGFMDALYEDTYYSNISCSSLIAGKVDTAYFDTNVGSAERIPTIATTLTKTLQAEDVAKSIFKIINRPKRVTIIPLGMDVLVGLNRFFPGIFRFLMRKTSFREH
jgi:short-subunit dehydrogenase